MQIGIKQYDELINDIAVLRDSEFHVCQYSQWQSRVEVGSDAAHVPHDVRCTCEEFDKVIDKLVRFKGGLEYRKGPLAEADAEVPESAAEENTAGSACRLRLAADLRAQAEEWRRESEFFAVYEVDEEEEKRCHTNADELDRKADALDPILDA